MLSLAKMLALQWSQSVSFYWSSLQHWHELLFKQLGNDLSLCCFTFAKFNTLIPLFNASWKIGCWLVAYYIFIPMAHMLVIGIVTYTYTYPCCCFCFHTLDEAINSEWLLIWKLTLIRTTWYMDHLLIKYYDMFSFVLGLDYYCQVIPYPRIPLFIPKLRRWWIFLLVTTVRSSIQKLTRKVANYWASF